MSRGMLDANVVLTPTNGKSGERMSIESFLTVARDAITV